MEHEERNIRQRKRRFLAFALALLMALSLLPVSAWAATYELKERTDEEGYS